MKLRGLSTTIAGLIVLTFLFVTVVTLLINMYQGTLSAHITLNNEINKKLRAVSLTLNITYDALNSNSLERHYIVENLGPSDVGIEFLTVTDGSHIYIVRANDTFNNLLSLGPLSIKTLPIANIEPKPGKLLLKSPLGRAEIVVYNGKLLGAILDTGAYIRVHSGSTETKITSYAQVAGSIKTNYFNLTTFRDIEDIVTQPNVILATDPAATTSDPSLLDEGVIQAFCYAGDMDSPAKGGFKVTIDSEPVLALYMHNMGPIPGMIILGGRDPQYNTNPINITLYEPFYYLAPFNESTPGIIAINTQDYGLSVCFSWFITDSTIAHYCWSNDNGNTVKSIIENALLKTTMDDFTKTKNPKTLKIESNTEGQALVNDLLGVIAWFNTGTSTLITYCPPANYKVESTEHGLKVTPKNAANCVALYGESRGIVVFRKDAVYKGSLPDDFTIYVKNPEELADGHGFKGTAILNNITLSFDEYATIGTSIETNQYPYILKVISLLTDKNLLSVHVHTEDIRNNIDKDVTNYGIKSFGIYYYSGYMGGNFYTYYYVDELYGSNGIIDIYSFVSGTTSGIRPYFVIADTDGNGLAELIFTDEWFKPGPVFESEAYHKIYDLSDVSALYSDDYVHPIYGSLGMKGYGCVEKTMTEFLYLKFGGKYAVNGSEIAEVAVQIRYSFHDAVGGDIDEIDNPKKAVWGFFVVDENGTVVTNSLYIYQQLSTLEDTWPPNSNFISSAAYLPIPKKPKMFYIAWGVSDPYLFSEVDNWPSYKGYINDLEYTVRVEWIGMWYLHR
jgi:hypothetical protein